jgi:hypothetical protein
MAASLVERAKAVEVKRAPRKFTPEELDLVAAWLRGEITFSQAEKVMEFSGNSGGYAFFALGAKELMRLGRIELAKAFPTRLS